MQKLSDFETIRSGKHVRFANEAVHFVCTTIPPIETAAAAPMDVDKVPSSADTLRERKISRAADFFKSRNPRPQPTDSFPPPTAPATEHIFSTPFLPPPPPSQSSSFGALPKRPHLLVENLLPTGDQSLNLPSRDIPPKRAADFFKFVLPTPMTTEKPTKRAYQFFQGNHLPISHPNSSQPPPTVPSLASMSVTSRPIVPLPSRRHTRTKIKLPGDTKAQMPTLNPPQFVFNTDDFVATQQTQRSWRGNHREVEWILSREDLHADQVDCDRELPVEMDDPWYPSFAISPADLNSLHQYILARYDILSFADYTHLLALFRNTCAIEAHNARQRYTEISEATASVEKLLQSLIQRLQDRHSEP